jgi:hypothetical protein
MGRFECFFKGLGQQMKIQSHQQTAKYNSPRESGRSQDKPAEASPNQYHPIGTGDESYYPCLDLHCINIALAP